MVRPSTEKIVAMRKFIASQLRNRRNELGITQRELADKCGLSRSYLAGIETEVYSPSLKTLFSLCDALQMDVEVGLRFFGEEGDNSD